MQGYVRVPFVLSEFESLKSFLPEFEVYRFEPTPDELERLGDGGVAIIDQWICAHARWVFPQTNKLLSETSLQRRKLLAYELLSQIISFKIYSSPFPLRRKCH